MNKSIFRLMAGFRRFRDKYYLQDELEMSVYQKLAASGQTPKTLLIGCSDSRVDPAILTDAGPGELFVIRNVANLVPPYSPSVSSFHGTSSALEFAIKGIKVDNVIVLGHRQCGGIRALLRGPEKSEFEFVEKWMSIAKKARDLVLTKFDDQGEDVQWRMAELESIKISLKNLRTFPFVMDAIHNRQLNLIGVYFDLEQGQLWEYDEGADEFRLLEI